MGESIRPANLADLPALVALESAMFKPAWSSEQLRVDLDRRGPGIMVATTDIGIVGYAIWRDAVDDLELLRIAVAAGGRRAGVGRELMNNGICAGWSWGYQRIFLEVAASNRPARALYAALGFCEIARRAGYYRDPPDDALVLALALVDAP